MKTINKVTLIGCLGADPKLRFTAQGTPLAKFSVATTESHFSDGMWQERPEWHYVVCRGRMAEIAADYLSKGSRVYLEGRLRSTSWEANTTKQRRTEILAGNLVLLDKKTPNIMESDNDQEIPF